MLEGLTPLTMINTCRVKLVSDQMEDSDLTILKIAVESPDIWKPSTLEKALKERGVNLPRYHIEKHRAGDCLC